MLTPLEKATKTITIVYRNPDLQRELSGVGQDHRGRGHDFLPEMARDEAKTLFAASVLYGQREANSLIEQGERILSSTFNSLPDNHPIKPLIGIELQLSNAGRGGHIDKQNLLENFERLVDSDKERNPHRVATVASWLVAWGERISDDEIRSRGLSVFSEIANQHKEWQFMTDNERQKIAKQQARRFIFRVLAPVTTNPARRESLRARLSR